MTHHQPKGSMCQSGQGKSPNWINGKDRAQFLIETAKS